MVDWKLGKRERACRTCTRSFEDGEALVSALSIEAEQVERFDTCLACWKKAPPAQTVMWWRTRFETTKKRGLTLNLEALEALFVQLEGCREVQLQELRYVLCLILMRKRRLKVERVERDDRNEFLVVSRPRRPDLLRVDVFDFSPEKIDELRARLEDLFEGAEAPALDGASTTASNSPQP